MNFNKKVSTLLNEALKVKRYKDLFVRETDAIDRRAITKRYYKDPECLILHRTDGPAVEVIALPQYADKQDEFSYYDLYFIDGVNYEKREWVARCMLPQDGNWKDMLDI